MQLSIKTNFPDVAKAYQQLHADIANKATVRALNGTIAQAKTSMSKEIRAEFNLPATKVADFLKVSKASASDGSLKLSVSLYPTKKGRSLNLANFDARQTSKGVTFKIKRKGPRQLIPGAFLINDGKTVMIRVGKDRLPIKALQTIDVAQMFNTKRINAKVVTFIRQKFPEVFAREAKYYTDRFNAKK